MVKATGFYISSFPAKYYSAENPSQWFIHTQQWGVSVLHHRVGGVFLCRSSDVMLWLYSFITSVVHQMSCCDCIRCHVVTAPDVDVVTAFFHHLYRSSDVMLWLYSFIISVVHQMSCCDCIRCHVVTASDVMLWLHSFITSIAHQMSCCDCIQSSPLSSSIVGIWFNRSLSLPAIHISSSLLCSLMQCLHQVMQAPSHELTGVRGTRNWTRESRAKAHAGDVQ